MNTATYVAAQATARILTKVCCERPKVMRLKKKSIQPLRLHLLRVNRLVLCVITSAALHLHESNIRVPSDKLHLRTIDDATNLSVGKSADLFWIIVDIAPFQKGQRNLMGCQ